MRIKNISAIFFTLMFTVSFAVVVHAAPAAVDETAVGWWWGEGPTGSAKIVRTNKGISGSLSTDMSNSVGSVEGLAVTVWLIIFNDPGECATTPCSEADLFNPDVMPDAIYGAGNIIDNSEVASFGFHLKAGDNSGSIADLFGMPTDGGEPFGLIYPRGAEVHYVLRLHGPMIPMEMPAQIKTYEGGCVDFAPFGYPPPANEGELKLGWGECQDVQAAINLP
ncbi:hypothetical protein ACFL1V_05850 [Pseudomonadota bacterium]